MDLGMTRETRLNRISNATDTMRGIFISRMMGSTSFEHKLEDIYIEGSGDLIHF